MECLPKVCEKTPALEGIDEEECPRGALPLEDGHSRFQSLPVHDGAVCKLVIILVSVWDQSEPINFFVRGR